MLKEQHLAIIEQLLRDCKTKCVLKDSAKIKGRASVDFGIFSIKGFTVRINEGTYWVNPPAVLAGGGKWIKIFWSDYHEEFWKPLSEKILAAFNEANNAEVIDNLESDEASTIDVSSIPF